MHHKRYLHKKLDVDSIKKEDTLDIQSRITLMSQAPTIVSNAIKAGWISYPFKPATETVTQQPSEWLSKYDCEKAYNLRQKGLTYRQIGKLLCVAIGKVTEILRHGEDIAVKRKLDAIGIKPPQLPKKSTVAKHSTLTKPNTKTHKKPMSERMTLPKTQRVIVIVTSFLTILEGSRYL